MKRDRVYNYKRISNGVKKHVPLKEKKVAICLLKRYSNLSNAEIGEQFGVSYSSVSKAAGSVEEQLHDDKGLRKEIDAIISHFKG